MIELRRSARWLVVLVAALAVVLGISNSALARTTSTDVGSFIYDVPAVARVDVHEVSAKTASSALLSNEQERSAAPAVVARGPSTTSASRSVATNTADDVLRLGTKDSWGNVNTLDDHFARHGADFGATSADDYARQASEFLQRPGTLTKIDPKSGVIRVYDPATEAFGAYNPTGTTRTFYIPDPAKHGYPTNLDYWNAQSG